MVSCMSFILENQVSETFERNELMNQKILLSIKTEASAFAITCKCCFCDKSLKQEFLDRGSRK
jgi:hypothetical protein